MSGKLGGLVVSLSLDFAQFATGMSKAEIIATGFASKLKRDVNDAIKSTTIAFGAMSLAGGAAFAFVDSQASKINSFKRFSEEIGDSATAFAGLSTVAATSGTGLDEIAAASVKLTTNLAKTDDEGTAAGKAIQALGLNLAQFKALSPVAQLDATAQALDKFQDGAGKAAAATALLGRGGATLLPFLHDLANAQEHNSALTQDQIDAAVNFTKALATLKSQSEDAIQVFVAGWLPALTEFINQLKDGIIAAGGFGRALLELGSINPFNDLDANIKETKDRIATLQEFKSGEHFTLSQALGLDTVSSQLTTAQHQLDFLLKQKARIDSVGFGMNDRSGVPVVKPTLHVNTNLTSGDTSRKILDGQIKAQEDVIKAEQQLLGDRESFLSSYYQNDQISLRDFYAGRNAALLEAFGVESSAYDKEIAALKAFAAKAKPTDRIDAENKIAEVIAKRGRLQQDVSSKSIQNWLDEQHALQQLKDSIEQAGIALSVMRGDTVAAAAAQFDFANRKLQTQVTGLSQSANPDDQRLGALGQSQLDQLRQLTIARASLSKATDDYSLTLDRLGIAQSNIDNLSASGALTDLQALRARSDATAAFLPALQQELIALQAVAALTGDPKDIVHAQQLAVQLGALAAQGDLVAKKFNDIGSGAFSQFLQDTINGTKTLRQAFADMAKSIGDSLSKIASDDIAQSLFGKGGTLSGIGDFASKLLGGSGGGALSGAASTAGTTAANTAMLGLSTTTVATDTSLTALAASATAAAAAPLSAPPPLPPSSGGGALSGAASTAGTTAANTAMLGLSTTTVATDTSLTALAASATAAAAALEAVSVSGAFSGGGGGAIADFAGTLFEGIGGLAGGTDFWKGGPTWVGENGPELVNLPRGAQVTPSDQSKGMRTINAPITINIPGNVSRATADQVARQAYLGVSRASRAI